MRRLITFGCSHTNHRYPTWANILGLNFDKLLNFGRGGSGQLYATHSLIGAQRHLNITKDDYIVIMMPEENRWDIELKYKEEGLPREHWDVFLPHHIKNDKHWLGLPDWTSKLNVNFGLLKSTIYINACLNILKQIGCDFKIVFAMDNKVFYPNSYKDIIKKLGDNVPLQTIGQERKGYRFIEEGGTHNGLKLKDIHRTDCHWIIPAHLDWVKKTFPNLYSDKYDSVVSEWHTEMMSEPKIHYDLEWGNTYECKYDFNSDELSSHHWMETGKNPKHIPGK